MLPRDIIKGNLESASPPRIGMRFGGGRMNDFCRARLAPTKAGRPGRWTEKGIEYYYDEWGNLWHRMESGSAKGEVLRPAIPDWKTLDALKFPDFDAPYRYESAEEKFSGSAGLYRLGSLPGFPFAICRYLRRMDNYLMDLILERKNIDILHERVTGMLERVISCWTRAGADGVAFAEDWGTQTGLLVSPKMWREIFKPLYARLCAKAREGGLSVFMHSCGYNREILEDLAETGVDCFLFDQPALYGLEELAAVMGKEGVCLCSPVDIQKVLPAGNRELIEKHAKRMIELFAGTAGGFIADGYNDLHGAGITEEADETAYRAFLENRFI